MPRPVATPTPPGVKNLAALLAFVGPACRSFGGADRTFRYNRGPAAASASEFP
jgi:hypothetical protein